MTHFPTRNAGGYARRERNLLPRFTQPFTSDVSVWREMSSHHPLGIVCMNIVRTCMQHSPGGYDCGNAGPGAADLALNVLNAFVPPRNVAIRRWGEKVQDDDPLKAAKGVVSRFALEHHQACKHDFIAPLSSRGGGIPAERLLSWIALRRRPQPPD